MSGISQTPPSGKRSGSVAFGEPVLVAKGISKFFPGVVALDNVDFEIRAAKSMPCSAKTEPENRRSSR